MRANASSCASARRPALTSCADPAARRRRAAGRCSRGGARSTSSAMRRQHRHDPVAAEQPAPPTGAATAALIPPSEEIRVTASIASQTDRVSQRRSARRGRSSTPTAVATPLPPLETRARPGSSARAPRRAPRAPRDPGPEHAARASTATQALGQVEQQRRRRQPLAPGAQHVGRADVARADLRGCRPRRPPGQQQPERDRAEQVAEQQGAAASPCASP